MTRSAVALLAWARQEEIGLRGVPIIDARELRKLRERGEMVELVEERRE